MLDLALFMKVFTIKAPTIDRNLPFSFIYMLFTQSILIDFFSSVLFLALNIYLHFLSSIPTLGGLNKAFSI